MAERFVEDGVEEGDFSDVVDGDCAFESAVFGFRCCE